MPDRLPSLILLVGFWIPPALIGRAAADLVKQGSRRVRPAAIFATLSIFVVAWSGAWFLFNVNRMPPYLPGATQDPAHPPPEAVAALAVFAAGLVLPGSAIACWWAYRRRTRSLGEHADAAR